MIEYRLEVLSHEVFETMIILICEEILGTATINFAEGKDGGRDGRFEGRANKFPSETAPWSGKFIIQAKHTSNPIASCSDRDFFGKQTSIINKEIEKIKTLKEANEIDNYLIFSNRKLTADKEIEIIKEIQQKTNLTNIRIVGKEKINTWLNQNKKIVKICGLDKYNSPLEFYDKDIKDIIMIFHDQRIKNSRLAIDNNLSYTNKEEKNILNKLDSVYYENQIKERSMKYFTKIDDFLQDPINEDYAIMYENFADELSNKIAIRRDSFDDFKEVFEFLHDKIFEQNSDELRPRRSLIWVFLHHLYFNCHIGRVK